MKISNSLHRSFNKYWPFFQWTFTIIYFPLLMYIVFFARRRRHITTRLTNLKPFSTMLARYNYLSKEPAWKTIDFYQNFYGNIALFIPLPIILITLFRIRNKMLVMMLAVAISTSIELLQYIFEIGVADIDDVILNSTGAFIGILIYTVWIKWVAKALKAGRMEDN